MRLSNDLLDELLGLVDRLTMRHQSAVTVETEDGGERRVFLMHEPLLEQLRNSVLSEKRSRVGAGGIPSERNVIDADALEQYEKISEDIAELYKEITDAKPFRDPAANLRHWFIAFSRQVNQRKISAELAERKYRKVAKMVASIESKLNPATVIEITAPCPRCGTAYGLDKDGIYRHAIVVESRVHQYKSLENTRALCVGCGAVWIHGQGMRQLRWEIDQVEAGRHAEGDGFENVFENATMGNAIGVVRPNSEGLA